MTLHTFRGPSYVFDHETTCLKGEFWKVAVRCSLQKHLQSEEQEGSSRKFMDSNQNFPDLSHGPGVTSGWLM